MTIHSRQWKFLRTAAPAVFILSCVLFLPTGVSDGNAPRSVTNELADGKLPPTDFTDYLWPTDAGQIITSTFAEYRRAHFHGGIDISTGNETGFRVFAARDGWVSRIRVSPTGYGKMLYVRHADGYHTTYAHLRNFNSLIDARVRKEQMKTGAYPVDIACTPEEFPVHKGEIIAYTGETGVGSPHLHFEIRDEHLEFVNPQLCNAFPRGDRILPVVRKLALQPLNTDAAIDGSFDTRVLDVRHRGDGQYEIPGRLHIRGEVGFAIDVRDQSGGSRFRHGVYSHELYIDKALFYSVVLNRAPSVDAHQSGLYYDWDLADAGRGRFQRLFVASHNDLPFYLPRGDRSGIVSTSSLMPGPHTFRIVSTDASGNTVTVTGAFVLSDPPRFAMKREEGKIAIRLEDSTGAAAIQLATRRWSSSRWNEQNVKLEPGQTLLTVTSGPFDVVRARVIDHYGSVSPPAFLLLTPPEGRTESLEISHEHGYKHIRFHLRSSGIIEPDPDVTVYEGDSRRTVPTMSLDLNHITGSFIPDTTFGGTRRLSVSATVNGKHTAAFHEFDIYPIPRGRSGSHIIDGGNLMLSYDSSSVLGLLFVEVEKTSLDDQEPGTTAYRLLPENRVLDKGILVSLRAPRKSQSSGLFSWTRKGWKLLAENGDNESGVLTGLLTETLGEVGVIRDSTAPSISRLDIRYRRARVPDVSFRFSDDFSGVEYQELKVYIDGKIAIPEIDGEHHRTSYQAPDPLPEGAHLLTVVLKDKLGNTATTERRFTVK